MQLNHKELCMLCQDSCSVNYKQTNKCMDTIKNGESFWIIRSKLRVRKKLSGNSEKQKLPAENHYAKSLDLKGEKKTKIIYIIKNSRVLPSSGLSVPPAIYPDFSKYFLPSLYIAVINIIRWSHFPPTKFTNYLVCTHHFLSPLL